MEQQANLSVCSWWSAFFFINWPDRTEPAWHLDLLIAHSIISPILDKLMDNMQLWRFHRRAARDEKGHCFGFHFYASAETAREAYDYINASTLLQEIKDAGLITRDSYDDTDKKTKSDIADTSDPTWPPLIRQSWPYFIEGVCKMWLSLIASMAEQIFIESKEDSLSGLLAQYQKVNAVIGRLWQNEGEHALLHHLNAIFGYEPVAVPTRSAQALFMRF